jgi:hypothetical protein
MNGISKQALALWRELRGAAAKLRRAKSLKKTKNKKQKMQVSVKLRKNSKLKEEERKKWSSSREN